MFTGPNISTDGLVLCLDAASHKSYPGSGTTWYDLSGNGNNGTLNNSPAFSTLNGGNFQFDGSNDNCSLSDTPQIEGNELTFSVWNYGLEVVGSSIIWLAGSNGTRILNVHLPWGGPVIYFDAGDGTGDVGNFDRINKNPSLDELLGWHHWVFTKNAVNGTMYIYLDGSLWHSGTGKTKTIGTPDTTRLIGSAVASSYHKGYISNLSLYNRELSSKEIAQLYNSTKSRFNL